MKFFTSSFLALACAISYVVAADAPSPLAGGTTTATGAIPSGTGSVAFVNSLAATVPFATGAPLATTSAAPQNCDCRSLGARQLTSTIAGGVAQSGPSPVRCQCPSSTSPASVPSSTSANANATPSPRPSVIRGSSQAQELSSAPNAAAELAPRAGAGAALIFIGGAAALLI